MVGIDDALCGGGGVFGSGAGGNEVAVEGDCFGAGVGGITVIVYRPGIVDVDLIAGGGGGVAHKNAVSQGEREGLYAAFAIGAGVGVGECDRYGTAVVGGGVGVEGGVGDGAAGAQADGAASVGGGVSVVDAVGEGRFFGEIGGSAIVGLVGGERATGEGGWLDKVGAAAVVTGGFIAGE